MKKTGPLPQRVIINILKWTIDKEVGYGNSKLHLLSRNSDVSDSRITGLTL
jgi:hypothetical protein